MEALIRKSVISGPCSIAMFDYQRVVIIPEMIHRILAIIGLVRSLVEVVIIYPDIPQHIS